MSAVIERPGRRMKSARNRVVEHSPGPNPRIGISDRRAAMDGTRKCSVDQCDRPLGKGRANYCEMHYYRLRRTGSAGSAEVMTRQPKQGQHLLWSRVEVTGFCWIWRGYVNNSGYGRVQIDGQHVLAHRATYQALVGPIGEGMDLDHLCRVTTCVNPDHLDPVTREENTRRGLHGVLSPYVDVCRNGHRRRAGSATSKRCLECHLIETHRRRGKPCTVESPCHSTEGGRS